MRSGEVRMGRSVFQKVLTLLESIRSTESGDIVFEHVADMLGEIDAHGSNIEQVYAEILSSLLKAIAYQFDSGDLVAVQIRMLQLRLVPPISKSELITLKKYFDSVSDGLIKSNLNVEKLNEAIQNTAETLANDDNLISDNNKINDQNCNSSANLDDFFAEAEDVYTGAEDFLSNAESSLTKAEGSLTKAEGSSTNTKNKKTDKISEKLASPLDSTYQQHVNQKNKEISNIRNTLARHICEAIAQNDQFGVLLGVELEALKESSSLEDVEVRRVAIINEISRLIENHVQLSEKFNNASSYLTMIESDNQQLSEELDRVRLLSLTDELTTLPNRRAFMRRLEDEVGRVKRYGYSISLMLIDLDQFKNINDIHGHAGGDAVLKSYAQEVLTFFRHHDMISRYGGEEFAVILPNTNKAGALSAFRKIQKIVSKIICVLNDVTIPMPTISAGLAQYTEGETPEQFIERADEALYRAKELGRNRVQLANNDIIKNGGLGKDVSAGHG